MVGIPNSSEFAFDILKGLMVVKLQSMEALFAAIIDISSVFMSENVFMFNSLEIIRINLLLTCIIFNDLLQIVILNDLTD